MLPFLIEIARVLPLVIFPALYFVGGDEDFVALGVLLFFVILFFLTLIAAMKTGDENPTRMEKVARYGNLVSSPIILYISIMRTCNAQ